MKFVSKNPFYNAPELSLKLNDKDPLFTHPLEIPKGYRFSIGTAESLDGATPAEKQVISRLITYKFAVVDDPKDAKSRDAVTKIDSEVKLEQAAAKKAEESRPMSVADQIALGVAQALQQLKAKA